MRTELRHRRGHVACIVATVDEMYNPTWSPDGRSIASSGMVGGVLDLFLYDVEHARRTRLTNDVGWVFQFSLSPPS